MLVRPETRVKSTMVFRSGLLLTSAFLLHALPPVLPACTAFVLKQDKAILLAKNLDWPIDDGILIINKKGEAKSSFPMGDQAFQWTARYGSVTFNQFGKEFPLGGINEKGLVVEELNYSPSQYPPAGRKRLNEFQWIQYQLDNFATVPELIANIHAVSIVPLIARLHYIACDREGRVAIVEFIGGKARCYTGADVVVPVLANDSYGNSLRYLRLHEGFGGTRAVSNGTESPERFVRAATLLQGIDAAGRGPLHGEAFAILDAVSQRDTQWSIVYDVGQGALYFMTRQITTRQKIVLSDFDLSGKAKALDLSSHRLQENPSLPFHDHSGEESLRLIRRVLHQLIVLDELSKEKAGRLLDNFQVFYQAHATRESPADPGGNGRAA